VCSLPREFSFRHLTLGRPRLEIDEDRKCKLIYPTEYLKFTVILIAVLDVYPV
jgi:hypothetical protein